MALPSLSRLPVPTAGSGPSKAAAEELVRNEEGPWQEIKAALDTRELTFSVGTTFNGINLFMVQMIVSHTYDEETATPEMRSLVAAVQTSVLLPTIDAHTRDAFEDTIRWCTNHIMFPNGEPQNVASDASLFFEGVPRLVGNSLEFRLAKKAMKWFTTIEETRVLDVFMKSLAARVGDQLRTQFNLSYVVQQRISQSAEMRYLQQQMDDMQRYGHSIESMPTLEKFRAASVAAPKAASYALFSVHPFSRVAQTNRPIQDADGANLFNSAFVGFQLRFRPLAMLRGVSKAGREVAQ